MLGQGQGMNRFFLFAALVILLAACDTPSPHFAGLPATRVTVDGSTFDVRVNALQAEALRTNAQYAPRLGPIGTRATVAMEKVSGCKVAKITGDAALVRGYLDCGKGAAELPRRGSLSYDCYSIDGISKDGDFTVQCDPG